MHTTTHTGPRSYVFLPNGAVNVLCSRGHIVDHHRPGQWDMQAAMHAGALTCTETDS